MYFFTLRMAKRCDDALKMRRWLIYRNFNSKQHKSTQLHDQNDYHEIDISKAAEVMFGKRYGLFTHRESIPGLIEVMY
jgi:hypothetical protein